MEQKDLGLMLETAVAAARLAGKKAMEGIGSVKVSIKNNDELVTQADAGCQQIIIERIKENYPDHGFIAEEGIGGKNFKLSPRDGKVWWAIDPIDGTNNFAHRMLLFTVSIAAMYEGVPVVGTIFEPATESMFTAVKGGQAQLNGRRIAAGTDKLDKFTSVGLDSNFDDGVPNWACEIMKRTRYRNLGSTALQLAYVAKGSFAATITSGTKLWDIAAGAIICETAGAVVTDWQGKKIFPVDLNGYERQTFHVIASNKKVHKELLDNIAGA